MGSDMSAVGLGAFVYLLLWMSSRAENEESRLEPPEFNLATGKNIWATATCGLEEDNTVIIEQYCYIGGAHGETDIDIYISNGQLCNECNKEDPQKWHPASNAIDGSNNWWMSPPLSRGMEYNQVNLTIDLGREFQVAYVTIKMGNSPRPGIWVLEKSIDYGKTYEPWQYFADSDENCMQHFGVRRSVNPTADDSVLCVTDFSEAVPLSYGEIFVPLLTNRPSASNFANSATLQQWTKATNVRLRLIHTKTLLGHLMSVNEGDPSVTRRYFYSIRDISIGGKCYCNGHAEECGEFDPNGGDRLWCKCKHNTDGINCEKCRDGFVQKPWRPAKVDDPFQCEPCNCFGHSDKCEYNATVDRQKLSQDIHGKFEGGGVCKHCKHNTDGINCHKCKPGFYRPYNRPISAIDACEKCRCNKKHSSGTCKDGDGMCECRPEYKPPFCNSCSHGHYGFPNCRPCECHSDRTEGNHCNTEGGECICKPNYAGRLCDRCADGYYNFPACLPCKCDIKGAVNNACDQKTGNCLCKWAFGGKNCDECMDGFYKFPKCYECKCNKEGTTHGICDKKTGSCFCTKEHDGKQCDQCKDGRYSYPECEPCDCSPHGSRSISCSDSGKCTCNPNYTGRKCDQCNAGYYQYPECLDCKCDSSGSTSASCDDDGKCNCHSNFTGVHCNKCKKGYFNFPYCEVCNCDPRGVKDSEVDCELQPTGDMCQCKKNVVGQMCGECKPRFWNIQKSNPDGCEGCDCHLPGVVGGIGECNSITGQCHCKAYVDSPKCKECKNGTFNLQNKNVFGCSDCECDVGGSLSNTCDKRSGQCLCRPHIEGRTCSMPVNGYYFPTLYHLKFEAEDARRHDYPTVHFRFDENLFPNSSGRGYAIFSRAQEEIFLDVNIKKPSNYHMILHYLNLNDKMVEITVEMTPDKGVGSTEMYKALLNSTKRPSFVAVTGYATFDPSMVLDPGDWNIKIMSKSGVLLDYVVLIPSEYYEASILTKKVITPCLREQRNKDNYIFCRHMEYLEISSFDQTEEKKKKVEKKSSLLSWSSFIPNSKSKEDEEDWNLQINLSASGRYVLLVIYLSPLEDKEILQLNMESTSQKGTDKGNVAIHPCNFSTPCRQVVQDDNGGIKVFVFTKSVVKLKVEGDDKSKIEIKTVVAIPFDQWSFDYIQPKSVCVKMDGKCMPTTFPHTHHSKTFEFESSSNYKRAYNLPKEVNNKNLGLIFVNKNDEVINIKGKVSTKRSYVLMVHYYQPDYSGFTVDVMFHNGRVHQAYLDVQYCPSAFGCRSVIRDLDGNIFFNITNKFQVELKKKDPKTVWLDYMRLIPDNVYEDKILEEDNIDQTALFIEKCQKLESYTDFPGFCRNSVFSITSHYNNGTLPCECNQEGSLSLICNKFGGQCSCKRNILGRKCDQCKTGYYGFPNCVPCKCPNQLPCNSTTGACLCPPTVTGKQCDQCVDYTYAFHEEFGCKDCSCNPEGVEKGNLKCDQITGECRCKKNVEGRTCNHCSAGYSSFPSCKPCGCDSRGTKPGICDEMSAECFCKGNVVGGKCDRCKEGTFNIDTENPDGCTRCYCSGKAKDCTSSKLYRAQVSQTQGWKLAEVKIKEKWYKYELSVKNARVVPSESGDAIHADLTTKEVAKKLLYFVAPDIYLGNKLTSYGGFLNYTITYSPTDSSEDVREADVIFHGSDTLIYPLKKWLEAENVNQISVKMTEGNFKLPDGSVATREKILEVIKDLKGLYIQATYIWPTSFTKLSKVVMETADDVHLPGARHALAVEQCTCPSNYKGLSCEECAQGYFRSDNGDCIPCQCNDHADECDPLTGICIGCRYNTIGDHCEKCKKGYYGNATSGKSNACVRCACPLTNESNNFAEDCQLKPNGKGIKCNCLSQYKGDQCESCATGYYGEPKVTGKECKPCECSGNINPNDPGSCDPKTGKCLKCLHNTSGVDCSKCAEGFYGDAVFKKNCKRCKCNTCGTSACNRRTGECECKTNVIGGLCDQCAPYHWNFNSCEGCRPCNCQPGSKSMQCDVETGECKCQPGVIGKTCDRCDSGYWNYTSKGCTDCGCHKKYSRGSTCNPLTGLCVCKSGLIGDKCDQCPSRFVLVHGQGCLECDICIHILLNETDYLNEMTNHIKWELNNYEENQLVYKRLFYIRNNATSLQDGVRLLNYDTIPMRDDIKTLKDECSKYHQNALRVQERSVGLGQDGKNFLLEVSRTEREINEIVEDVKKTWNEIVAYNDYILNGSPALEVMLPEAQIILSKIENMNFKPYLKKAQQVLESIQECHKKAQRLSDSVLNSASRISVLHKELAVITHKSNDLADHATNSTENIDGINLTNIINKYNKIIEDIKIAQNNITILKVSLKEASDHLRNATENQTNTKSKSKTLYADKYRLVEIVNQIKALINSRKDLLKELKDYVIEAATRAENLKEQASDISKLFAHTRNSSANAVNAANAYKNIVDAVTEAKDAAKDAQNAAVQALEMPEDILEKIVKSSERSLRARFNATEKLSKVQTILEPNLKKMQKDLDLAKDLIEISKNKQKEINSSLEELKHEKVRELTRDADSSTEESNQISKDILSYISNTAVNAKDSLREVQNVSKIFHDAKVNISQAGIEIEKSISVLPKLIEAKNLIGRMQSRHKVNVKKMKNEMNKLRNSISNAINEINRISVGVKFSDNSTIMLKNPKGLTEIGTSGNISMYFQTKEKNGLLFYLGNEMGTKYKLRRFSSDDFVAIEIEDGYPTLKIDLGSGAEIIRSDKFVADGSWYQIIINRTGKIVRLITCGRIRGRKVCQQKKKSLKGISTVLDLDQNLSKIFVGGYPNVFAMQLEVNYSAFTGGIEELSIGNTPVSLWNFEEAQNIYGNRERDDKDEEDEIELERVMRFDGTGYVTLKGDPNQIKKQFTIIFNFKTTSKDGLLFLVKNSHSFLSIELSKGSILYQFDLGNGMAVLSSGTTSYNDGKWHSVEAGRQGNMAILKIDNEHKAYGSSPGNATFLITTEIMYFGGFPQDRNFKHISNKPFVGCMRDVQIESKNVPWSTYLKAYGVSYGCSEKVENVASFRGNTKDFIRLPNITAINYLQLSLKFNTTQENGLLFYATDASQWNTISLSMANGSLVMYAIGKYRIPSGRTKFRRFNDGKWHAVSATLDRNTFILYVDDYFTYRSKNLSLKLEIDNGNIYFGGVPEGYDINSNNAPHQEPFIGCIGDVTVNDHEVKFQEIAVKSSAMIGKCNTERYSYDQYPFDERHTLEYYQGKHSLHTKANCSLPLIPRIDDYEHVNRGYRYGTQPHSYTEYSIDSIRIKHNVSIEFKTDHDTGIIFYTSFDKHSLALFLEDGKLKYAFSCHDYIVKLSTKHTLDDAQWHSAAFTKHGSSAKLYVDNNLVKEKSISCKNFKITNSFYVGGISSKFEPDAQRSLNVPNTGFNGCIRNLQFYGHIIDQPTELKGVIPCSDTEEYGAFFSVDAGYMRIAEHFDVGRTIEIKMSIKPRKLEGLLLSVHGKKDFLVLQMSRGKVIFTVGFGGNIISTEYEPLEKNLLCNGHWHNITATKHKNIIILAINEHQSIKTSHEGTTDTQTSNPLFLGGHADIGSSLKGVITQESFVGCISGLSINSKRIHLNDKKSVGKIILGVCPTS